MPKLTATFLITRPTGTELSLFNVGNIPFPVKSIKVKCLAMTSTSAGNSQYLLVNSNLIDNKSMGFIWGDSVTSFNPYSNVHIEFLQSRQITGQYTLTLRELDDTLYTTPVLTTEYFSMILEFISDDSDDN